MKSIRLSLISASLLLAVSGMSFAQAPASTGAVSAVHSQTQRQHGADRHAKHLETLHAQLNLSASQDAAWQSFVQTMQKPGHPVHLDRAAFEKMTTPERLDQMQTMRQQRDAHMQKHAEATRVFYGQLTAEQKVIFDAQSMRHMSRMQGSMHASKHEHGHRH